MIYRKANIKDLEKICQLRGQLKHDPDDKQPEEYVPYSPKRDRVWIGRCLRARNRMIFIAEQDNQVLAHAIIAIQKIPKKIQPYYTYKTKALLVHLLVDQKFRRQGIASNLIQYTNNSLKKIGVEFMDLECYMYNQNAAKLYQKLGFKDVFVTKRLHLK